MQIIKLLRTALFSNKVTLVLFVIYAFAMAYGTFLENDYGTAAVWAVIYNAWWFELIMALLALNFIANIFKYRLYSKEKWAVFMFHIGFVITLLGALVTRYTGIEGTMSIRENATANHVLSNDMYFQALTVIGKDTIRREKKLKLSNLTIPNFKMNIGTTAYPVYATCKNYVPDAEAVLVEGNQNVLSLAITNGRSRKDLYLFDGESTFQDLPITIGFNTHVKDGINIMLEGDSLTLQLEDSTSYLIMQQQLGGTYQANEKFTVKPQVLYNTKNISFVIKELHQGVQHSYAPTQNKEKARSLPDMMEIEIEQNGTSNRHQITAAKGVLSKPVTINLEKGKTQFLFGPKIIDLPFAIHLKDFILERYPGSRSPSSYASKVKVIDGDESFDYHIFMNNVLDYKGYRFFQASYDTDELGTVLSVNKDYWGTMITYLGYTLLTVGMFFALFGKNTRFQHLNRRLKQLKKQKQSLMTLLLCLFCAVSMTAQTSSFKDSLNAFLPISEQHAEAFGRLMVQDMDGRIKPVNTLASELCRKLFRSTNFTIEDTEITYNENQLFLGLNKDPQFWQFIPIVKIDPIKFHDILEEIGKPAVEKLAFRDFFDENSNYRLAEYVDIANNKKAGSRYAFDKEMLAVDERFNLLYQALSGDYLRIFPKRGDENNTWYSYKMKQSHFPTEDSLFVAGILGEYYKNLNEAQLDNNWVEAEKTYSYIKTYQQTLGEEVIPSEERIEAELKYNRLQLFNVLFPIYWVLGTLLLMLAIAKIFFYKSNLLKYAYYIFIGFIVLAFLLQTYNMGLRWFAGDYPPWSNGYEMIILVAWFLVLFGIVFISKTDFALPLATLFAGTLLFVAFLDWLNPEITNLVPVLKSYWLKIHVAIIVASYAPLGLCALLGFVALLLIIFNGQSHANMRIAIKELTALNEISMTIGLYLLTIGTFLGGVWANESWGRYWAWDPKETWALISIIVYTFVVHMRLVPKLQGDYLFGITSVIAFFSIIMTSFGVNYYLSGLHSYAQGDPMPIPTFIYVLVATVVVIGILGYQKNKEGV